MSQYDDDDSKPWTEHDLKEAVRRINAGEINFKEAEDYYGISPRTIHRQRAIENMRAQLNPEKAKKTKTNPSSTKKDVTVLRKPVDISCTAISDVVNLLNTGTEEVKQLLNYECDLIYECKVCKNLFRSLVNFISHKRVYCCDMYSVLHTRTDDGENGSETHELQMGDKIKSKENVKEFTAKPFRITCRKDLTSVLKRITSLTEFAPTEPILKIEHIDNSPNAYQQTLVNNQPSDAVNSNRSPSEQPMENVETSPEAEPKAEITTTDPKISEKTAVPASTTGYVAEKRFRCPVCAVNFTIKKSVMRHLKAVHNQSAEQMERLKPRIQMHYIRKKAGPIENKLLPSEKKCALTANKNEKDQKKNNWEKNCFNCNRHFINRNAYAAHSRTCNKLVANQESNVDLSKVTASFGRSLQPVVSLTPLSSPSNRSEKSSDSISAVTSTVAQADSTNQQPTSAAAASSTKITTALPSLSSAPSSTCKKIGIQVRMNYGKANTNPTSSSTNANGTVAPSTYPSTPISVATSSSSTQSSANNSRRSSFAASTAKNEDQADGHHSTATRSSNGAGVLANILETLLDKKSLEKLIKATAPQATSTPLTATVTLPSSTLSKCSPLSEVKKVVADTETVAPQVSPLRKKLPKNKVSVLCEDCRVSYALDEFKCGTSGGGNTGRTFRCAFRNCDFKCNDKRQLLPHLNAKHAVMAEGELAQVQATFVAECRGVETECSSAAKKRNLNSNDKTEGSTTVPPRKTPVSSSSDALLGNQSGATSKQQSQPLSKVLQPLRAQPPKALSQQQRSQSAPMLKRKLGAAISSAAQTAPSAKRKPLNVRQSSTSDSEATAVRAETKSVAPSSGAEVTLPGTVKRENCVDDESALAVQAPVTKKNKKTSAAYVSDTITVVSKTSTSAPAENKSRSFPRIKLKQTPEKPLVNGIGLAAPSSSSDDENDSPFTTGSATARTAGMALKAHCAVLRKQNAPTLTTAEIKPPTKTPSSTSARVVNCQHELSSSSSTPDSDLDPYAFTEENLKKSIMTIIFGKDMPTEKMEEREKSPTSSSTSSDSSKEKRYSVRIAKQSANTKNIVSAVDCREDKVTKIAIPNKVKATR